MTSTSPTRPIGRAVPRPASRGTRALEATLAVTGAFAVLGGALLAAQPDGSLLAADPAVLRGTPFDSWRIPGLLLLALVGFGFLATAAVVHRGHPYARPLSIAAGGGLVAFEAAEFGWLGFQPLELVFAVVGCVVVVLAVRSERSS